MVDCFAGQPKLMSCYRIDPGKVAQASAFDEGFKNEDIRLTDAQLLTNIQTVQKHQNLPVSKTIDDFSEVDKSGNSKTKPKTYKPGAKVISISRWRPALERLTATSNQFLR